jgi:hypothetical protein
MQTRDEIKQMNRALQCACENSAAIISAINRLTDGIDLLYINTLYANWNTTPGNSIDYTYDANNNVTLAEHYEGVTLMLTQAFTYDANNNCTNITTT